MIGGIIMSNQHIHKRNDGNYYFKLFGKTYVRAKRKDAEKYYTELLNNEKFRKLVDDYGKTTVAQLMYDWLDLQKGLTEKVTTYDRKVQIVKNQIVPYFTKQQVISLTSTTIQTWLNELAVQGYSKSTIKKSKEYLQAALRFFKILNKFEENPFAEVKIPASAPYKESNDIVYYTEKELKQIYAAATKKDAVGNYIYRLGDSVIVLGETGMRSGEFLALTWNDIDFKNNIISINKTRQHVINHNKKTPTEPSYVDVINKPKTKSSIRTIPMSKKCKAAMKRLYKLNETHQYVSSTEKGTPISVRNFARMFRDILYAAEMDKAENPNGLGTINKIAGPHSMRHSFATNLINKKGANIAVVSALLGHADISVTVNKYLHTKDEDKINTIKLLD